MKWHDKMALAVVMAATVIIAAAQVAAASGITDWVDLVWWLRR